VTKEFTQQEREAASRIVCAGDYVRLSKERGTDVSQLIDLQCSITAAEKELAVAVELLTKARDRLGDYPSRDEIDVWLNRNTPKEGKVSK